MKRLSIALAFVFAMMASNGFAQDESKVSIGVHGSSGVSWLKTQVNKYESNGLKFSYGFGAKIDYNFAKTYFIGTGFDVNFLGGKLMYPYNYQGPIDTNYGTLHRAYEVKYLDIPLNLTLKTKEIGYFTYFVQFGFVGSFRLSSFAQDEFHYDDGATIKPFDNVDVKDTYNFLKGSFNVGLGTEYNMNNNISFYGRLFYTNGITDVLGGTNMVKDDFQIFQSIDEEAFLDNVGISVGILF
jgi:opacity protein-like surface antigen